MIDDDGFIVLPFRTAPDAPPVEVRLDLYEAQQAYSTCHAKHGDGGPEAVYGAWRNWLAERGFPPMSVRAAVKVMEAVNAAIDALGKAGPGSANAG